MTIRNQDGHENGKITDVCLWFCQGCNGFHIKAGEILLTFDRLEFSEFTHSVCDCYTANASPVELASGL